MSLALMMRKMWPFMRPYRRGLVLVVGLVIGFVIISRSLPILFGLAIDEGIEKGDLSMVWLIASAYLIFEVLRSSLSFAQSYLMQKVGNRILYSVREKLIHHVQRLPARYFDKNPIGRTVTRVTNDIHSLGELFTQGFTAIFVNVIELVSIIVALTYLSWQLSGLTLFIAPLLVWVSVLISRKIRLVFAEQKKIISAINSFTAESINGIKVIQLFNNAEKRRQGFAQLSGDYRDQQFLGVRLFALLWPLLEAFNLVTILTALFFGALLQSQLDLTVGTLTAFILLLQGFFRPLRVILERYNTLQNSLASADRIFTLLEEAEEPLKGASHFETPRLRGDLKFKDLYLRYEDSGPWVLKNINLHVLPGQSVALVGRTGSGKTSLVAALQKLYPYQEGEIFIDDIPLSQIPAPDVRRRLAVVQQDPFLFRGTVASNISLNSPTISRSQVERAAQKAHCYLDLDSIVEEKGANLSLGERQLIAFARALAFDPDILILDEATANIDSLSEQRIQQATEEITTERTSLIIAHRLSTVLKCDKIVVLSQGEVAEVGTHAQLMAKAGLYSELCRAQLSQTYADQSARDFTRV